VRCHGFPARSFHLQAEQHCNQGDGVKTGLTLGALCVIALTGCELVTEPDDHPPGSRLPTEDFLAWDARRDGPMPELEIRGESGRIFIQGGLDTPVPCYRVEGWSRVSDRTVQLSVVASYMGGVCITVVGAFGYEAIVRDLTPGTYTVRLTHIIEKRREVVDEAVVVVQ